MVWICCPALCLVGLGLRGLRFQAPHRHGLGRTTSSGGGLVGRGLAVVVLLVLVVRKKQARVHRGCVEEEEKEEDHLLSGQTSASPRTPPCRRGGEGERGREGEW